MSTARPEDDITNSDSSVCPTSWSLVGADGNPLTGVPAQVLSVSDEGFIRMS